MSDSCGVTWRETVVRCKKETPGKMPGVFVLSSINEIRQYQRVSLWLLSGLFVALLGGCSAPQKSVVKSAPVVIDRPVRTPRADRVIIEKSRRTLSVYRQGLLLGSFPVALGQNPIGPKTCQGDNRTPEGVYAVTEHKRDSSFYRALRLSYPLPADSARAEKQGCKPGGDIMIHGLENGYGWVGTAHRSADWTRGCIAVTNEEMDTLWTWVPDGAVVEIRP